MTELALPRYILGRTDFTTRKISLRHEPPGLDLELRESQRLKELFDDCIYTAKFFERRFRKSQQESRGIYRGDEGDSFDEHYMCGVVGGLEIHCSLMACGSVFLHVFDEDEPVFDGESYTEDRKIITYIPGDWEKRILPWIEEAKRNEGKLVEIVG